MKLFIIINVQQVLVYFFPAILLRSIKVPYFELKRRIIEVDEAKLDAEQLERLIRCMPETKQMNKLAALKKDEFETLCEAEQFGFVVRNALLLNPLHTYRPRWLAIYPDGLPVCNQSPIQVLTGPSVD